MTCTTTHTSCTLLKVALCAVILAPALQGCGPMTSMVMLVDEKYGGGNYKRALEREAYLIEERDALQIKYDAYAREADDYIATTTPQIEAHIEAGEIGPALVKLHEMDLKLHPVGDNPPRKGITAVVAHSGRGQRDYIRDAAKRTLARVDAVMAAGKFQKLDGWLARHERLDTMDEATRQGFEQKQAALDRAWLDALVKATERTRQSHPGSALVYALKGQQLAQKTGDDSTHSKLGNTITTLSEALAEKHGYVYTLGSTSGTHARDVASRVERSKWDPKRVRFQDTRDQRVNGVLAFSIDEPRYARSTSQKTGSFRYKSGTEQVTNPAYEDAQRDIERAQDNVSDAQSDLDNMRRDTQGWENTERDRKNKLAQAKQELSSAQSRLSGIPTTVTRDVFDEYTYPITVHELRTSWNLDATIEGAPRLDGNVASFLTDDEHAAYSKNDGSVSADPAKPPAKPSGLAKLQVNTAAELLATLDTSFLAYQAGMLDALPEQGEDRVHSLAIYVFISPRTASKEAVAQLEELADVNGIVDLIANMK